LRLTIAAGKQVTSHPFAEMAANQAEIVELLKALSSADNATRQKAETMYQQAKQSTPDNLMVGMLTVLGNASVEEAVRRHGAVLLRQMMVKGPEKDFVFARIAPQNQQEVASELLKRFEQETVPKLQKKIGDIVSKLVEYVCDKDDPKGSLAPGNPCGWPALLPQVFRMADPSTNTSTDSCEAAIRLLKDCVSTLKDDIVAAKQQLGQVLQLALAHPNLKLRTAALLFVCEIVGETEKKDFAPLMATVPVLIQVLTQLAQAGEEELLQEAIQGMTEVASIEPDFFKQQLQQTMEPAKFMASVARTRQGVESGIRNLALEWLVTYLEKRVKWLTKHLQGFAPLVLEACMELMLEVEDGEEELKVWVNRMDDEEGDEDEDELFHAGEEAIDRVVEAVTMENLGPALFRLIGHFSSQEQWQAKHAALAAVKQTVEYVEEQGHVDEMAKLLLQNVDHPHPRVRYTALHAIGQLANDQAPHFQENWHQTVMATLLKKMDDGCDRVAAMSMSAFVSFGEELDNSLMAGYAPGYMEKLVAKLQTTQHRGLREESITSIAVIAGVIEKDFSRYYDVIMPMLKQFVMHATSEKENRLRGKAFECMSLLGIAVGKEKFLPDANEALSEMMKTSLEADDVQREYIKEASERICQCLKKDFAPFLPNLLVGIFKSLSLEEVNAATANPKGAGADDDDDDQYVQVSTGDGKLVRVRTQKFEEMMQSAQLLHTFVTELESAFMPWVQPTAQALLPILSATDQMAMFCDEVRGVAFQVWALCIKAARAGAKEQGVAPDLAQQLLRTGLQQTFSILEKSQEPEMLGETASGITECVKNAGPGILSSQEILQLVEKIFVLIDQSFERTKSWATAKQKQKAADASTVPRELGDEEDEDERDADADEEQLRRNYEEVLGGIMEVAPAEFVQCLQPCGQKITTWLTSGQKVLALYLACDLLLHLKDQSVAAWPIFMPEVFRALGDADHDLRTAAAYAVNLAAPLQGFAEAAPQAFRSLAQIVGSPRPKKRDNKAKLAFDNSVAALLTLAVEKASLCPAEIQAWPLVIAKLPLKDDEDEAKKVHDKLADLVLQQHEGVLGTNGAHLGAILSVLAEVYHVEDICKKESEEKILKIFTMLPKDRLQAEASKFTEKQQKKIEKMLSS